MFIPPTVSQREQRCTQSQSISPVTLSNMSLYLLIRFRDNKWKGWPLWAVCVHKWIFLIWEINRLPSHLPYDWSHDLVTETWWMMRWWSTRVMLSLSWQRAWWPNKALSIKRQCRAAITTISMSGGLTGH